MLLTRTFGCYSFLLKESSGYDYLSHHELQCQLNCPEPCSPKPPSLSSKLPHGLRSHIQGKNPIVLVTNWQVPLTIDSYGKENILHFAFAKYFSWPSHSRIKGCRMHSDKEHKPCVSLFLHPEMGEFIEAACVAPLAPGFCDASSLLFWMRRSRRPFD